MDDEQVLAAVRDALVWAKAEVVTIAPDQIQLTSLLAEHPICLDSLESVAMVTRLEETVGLVARDEHFFAGSVRTVADVVAAVRVWISEAAASRR